MNLHTIVHLPVDQVVRVGLYEYRLRSLQERIRKDAEMLNRQAELRRRMKNAGPMEAERLQLLIDYISTVISSMANNMDTVKRMKREWREARTSLDKLYEARSWLLLEGELKGYWVQCANLHDCYSDRPKEEGWLQAPLLGRYHWLCSMKCRAEWQARMFKRLEEENQRRVEVTFEGGQKAVMATAGKGMDGTPQLAGVSAS